MCLSYFKRYKKPNDYNKKPNDYNKQCNNCNKMIYCENDYLLKKNQCYSCKKYICKNCSINHSFNCKYKSI